MVVKDLEKRNARAVARIAQITSRARLVLEDYLVELDEQFLRPQERGKEFSQEVVDAALLAADALIEKIEKDSRHTTRERRFFLERLLMNVENPVMEGKLRAAILRAESATDEID